MVRLAQQAVVFIFVLFLSSCGKTKLPDQYQMPLIEGALASLDGRIFSLVSIPTFRSPSPVPTTIDEAFLGGMRRAQGLIQDWVRQFNTGQKTLQLQSFEWRDMVDGNEKWVFGYRLGNGQRKIAFIAHLDTVPPGEWQPSCSGEFGPFNPYTEDRELRGKKQRFIVGRGALDDKGPAVVGLQVMQALARRFESQPKALQGVMIELVLDTSEETGSSTEHYFDSQGKPEVGVVMDGLWCMVAEKGVERPVFKIALDKKNAGKLWIESLSTPRGAVNQIPDSATLRIAGRSEKVLDEFVELVENFYHAYYLIDDPTYPSAPIKVSRDGQAVVITAAVSGAQHGSAPELNLKSGWNPLVSLANFAAYLARSQRVADNSLARMARFIAWTWSTGVFGEQHPEMLARHDQVFTEGNGTTYALTRFYTEADHAELHVDVRYALGHHAKPWDGHTPGTLTGESVFAESFSRLADQFNSMSAGSSVTFTTRTAVAPDLKDPNSPAFQSMFAAYKAVTGKECPRHAIGGGTDAKGYPNLMAMGPTFCQYGEDCLGPPRNYHGVNEGVPLEDLTRSARIYYRWAVDQVLVERHRRRGIR